jgi:hypothetical protein
VQAFPARNAHPKNRSIYCAAHKARKHRGSSVL